MSQLPTQRWSPSAVLDIITASNDISCAGITLKGLPCRWDLGGDPKRQARNSLISMSQRSPREALDDLPHLARLCLCQKNHQQQAARVVAEWTDLIELYISSLEREDTRNPHRRGVRGPESRGSKLSVDEITAELDALSIRQEELRSMLQDALISEDGSARTTPSQNRAHLVNQTPPSGSESSRAGQGQRRGSPSREGWKRVFGRGKPPN
jgi:hypothetical protein